MKNIEHVVLCNGDLEDGIDVGRAAVERFLGEKVADDRFRTPTLWNALHGGG